MQRGVSWQGLREQALRRRDVLLNGRTSEATHVR